MITWIGGHKYTLVATVVFAALVVWIVFHPHPLWQYAAAAVYGAEYGCVNAPRRRPARTEPPSWRPPGPSLPCPPGCHIRVAHRHDPIEAFR